MSAKHATTDRAGEGERRSRSLLFSLAGAALGAYLFGIRPWLRRWGATDREIGRTMPGDRLVIDANYQTTRGISIYAPVAQVWPWLVQMGQGRGGLYSYDGPDNLAGLNMRSADRILPEFQELEVGDTIPLEPGGSGFRVQAIEPGRSLVLFVDGCVAGELGSHFGQVGAASTWAWTLREISPWETRLLVRWRARYPTFAPRYPLATLIGLVIEPVEFMMERRMLLGIKCRAEAPPR